MSAVNSFALGVAAALRGGSDIATLLAPMFALGLAAVHIYAGRLQFLGVIPRSRWLSLAGGASVAYVFVHLFPEIQQAAEVIRRSDSVLTYSEHHVYLISLTGFVVFYGLERYVQRADTAPPRENDRSNAGVFWLHIGSFAVYNALVGYLLLHREESGAVNLVLFFIAMALHFVVNDYGLREHHEQAYRRRGRWVLSGAVLVGLGGGYVVEVSELLLSILVAFLAGGIILNVIKEELPTERQSRFWAFATGVVGYTILLLLV